MPDLAISGLSSADPASTALLAGVVNSTTVRFTLDEAVGFVTTAAGDMMYAAAARNMARLAAGTSGSYLRTNAGLPAWLPDRWQIAVQFNSAAASQAINVPVPVNVNIDEWHMVLSTAGPTSAVGSAVVEVRVENRSSTPAASGSQISSGSVPTLSNTNDGGSTAITSWSATTVNAGQWFTFYLVSVSSADTVDFSIGGTVRSS